MPKNHLAKEASRYLQQHATNPVDWYPWSAEAIAKAKQESKPILLSVGYSACHWCHVMENESFVDQETADLMNRLFINIKVDREERPDLDKIYQMAHQLLTGRNGGWPLTVFLTPHDLTPFFSGTYFPKRAGLGTPSFKEILLRISELYQNNLENIVQQNQRLQTAFDKISIFKADDDIQFTGEPLLKARHEAATEFDATQGGFGVAPKFPHPTLLEFLLRRWSVSQQEHNADKTALAMVQTTLEHMARGGFYDQLSGGFFRYTVDSAWQIPHFEKMLYDNAQLLGIYAQAAAIEKNPIYIRIIQETTNWLFNEMCSADGAFYSTLDADSEHEEGKFYYWDREQIKNLLTAEEYNVIAIYFGLDQQPNFEQHWHLTVRADLDTIAKQLSIKADKAQKLIDSARHKLLSVREKRIYPGKDTKVITSWNALLIKNLALAGYYINDKKLITAAERALEFIIKNLYHDQQLYAYYQNGRSSVLAFLDDYAFLLDAVLTLLQVRWKTEYLNFAINLAEKMLQNFYDDKKGAFFFINKDQEKIIYNPKSLMDEAVPAGNGIAAYALQRLGNLLGETRYLAAAENTLRFSWASLIHYASVHCALLFALEELLNPAQMIILRGKGEQLMKWQEAAKKQYRTNRLIFAIPESEKKLPKFLNAKKAEKNKTIAYICQGYECQQPITDFDDFVRILEQ